MTPKLYVNGHKPKHNQLSIELYSNELERGFLGNLLILIHDPSEVIFILHELEHEAGAGLKPNDFYMVRHQEIFKAIKYFAEHNKPTDAVSLQERVLKSGKFNNANEMLDYIIGLMSGSSYIDSAIVNGKSIVDYSQKRKTVAAAQKIVQSAHDSTMNASDLMDLAEKEVFEVRQGHKSGLVDGMEAITDRYLDVLLENRESGTMGLPSTVDALTDMLKGYRKGALYIIAGRPGMGKSAMMLGDAQNLAINHGKSVALFTLEMSEDLVMSRLMANRTGYKTDDIEAGKYLDDAKFHDQLTAVRNSKLHIDTTRGITPHQVRSKCVRLKMLHGLDAIFIDYAQIMRWPQQPDKRMAVMAIADYLTELSGDLDLPIILAAQLSRKVEDRSNRRPQMSDLAESGQLENNAFGIVLMYRDEYYNGLKSEKPNQVDLIVAKSRQGSTGEVPAYWQGECQAIRNLQTHKINL